MAHAVPRIDASTTSARAACSSCARMSGRPPSPAPLARWPSPPPSPLPRYHRITLTRSANSSSRSTAGSRRSRARMSRGGSRCRRGTSPSDGCPQTPAGDRPVWTLSHGGRLSCWKPPCAAVRPLARRTCARASDAPTPPPPPWAGCAGRSRPSSFASCRCRAPACRRRIGASMGAMAPVLRRLRAPPFSS